MAEVWRREKMSLTVMLGSARNPGATAHEKDNKDLESMAVVVKEMKLK